MIARLRSHRRAFRTGALVAVLALLALTQGLSAASCVVYDKDGHPRSCTFIETLGECVVNALDSYESCLDHGGTLWDLGCLAAVEVDILVCNLTIPIALVKSAV